MKRIAAVLAVLVISATSLPAQEKIRIRGEDTMIYVAQRLSALYRQEHAQGDPTFEIAGGGGNNAAAKLAEGQVDIAQLKSPLKASAGRVVRVPIGIEYAVFYVHPSNPIKELSVADLRAMYSGKVTNWKQLGGHDAPIRLFAGESTSGLEDFFQATVLHGDEPAPYWGKTTAKELVAVVAGDPNAIGYASLYPSGDVRVLAIRAAGTSAAVEPTSATLRNLSYPVARFIYWYLPHQSRPSVREFAEWVFSNHGQLVVEGVGFMPLRPENRSAALNAIAGK